MSGSILIVEDDIGIASVLTQILEGEGFTVKLATNGEDAIVLATKQSFDLIILDIMLPGLDGFNVCSLIREKGINIPILMLTVKDQLEDKVKGFEKGADDYLTKPFAVKELIARVKALLRRYREYRSIIKYGNLLYDPIRRKVFCGNKELDLSSKEMELLELFLKNKGKVLGEGYILKEIWGTESMRGNILKVYIHHLRRKLKNFCGDPMIATVRGVGYYIKEIP